MTQADEKGSVSEIYIRDLGASSERLLVSIEVTFIGSISWSADGEELIYVNQKLSSHTWIINRIHSNGGNTQVLTSADFNSETASWFSPSLIDTAVQLIPIAPSTEDVITYARINTRYGDTLNLRAQTSTDATILEELPADSVVSIISETVEAGGYRWRQVRSPTGRVGWCVESADNVDTLLFGDNLTPELVAGQENIGTSPRYRYPNQVYGLKGGEIWNRPDYDHGHIVEYLTNATELQISGIAFAGRSKDGASSWWYLV